MVSTVNRPVRAAVAFLASAIALCFQAHCRGQLTIVDFNSSTRMNWTWDDFQWTAGNPSIRIYDPADSTGGAGRLTPGLDLSSYENGRFVFDMMVNPPNGSNNFTMALEDTAGRRNWWSMNVTDVTPGAPVTLVSPLLSNPTGGTDVANFDLAHINFFQIDGEWQNPNPFDMSFDKITVSNTAAAPPPYPGHEPDAPWRAEAAARIDAIRKADLRVTVTDAGGNPVPGATVGVHMQRHEFGFGSAVTAYRLRDDNPQYAMYKQKVAQLFNIATIENNLKWPAWVGEYGSNFTQQGAARAVDWLAEQDIDVRGHNIVWPGYNALPSFVKAILNQAPLTPQQEDVLRTYVDQHIDDIVGRFAGKLVAWDVVNEPWDNHDIMDNLPEGNAALVDWYKRTRENDPTAKLYLNDYNILSTGGATNTAKQQFYYDTLKYLLANDAPLDGVGFQGHFSESTLTGPEQLWTILDRFAELGLDMQITEFDIGTDDEQLQADYTRDFLTAIFAHEGVDAELSWGFWEDAYFDPRRAMFRSDWSIKPNGQAFLDLVFGEWWTDEDVGADALGQALIRAFKGEHEVSVAFGQYSDTATVTLGDGGLELAFQLPYLLGDYNRDGAVDAADYVVWRTMVGSNVALGAGADGNGDGIVDGSDYQLWRAHFGNSAAGRGSLSGNANVPEPATFALALLGAIGLGVTWRIRRGRRGCNCGVR